MKLFQVFSQVFAALELDVAVITLEVLLVGVHQLDVILQLVLVAQDLTACLEKIVSIFEHGIQKLPSE